jgi:hypothetical protein
VRVLRSSSWAGVAMFGNGPDTDARLGTRVLAAFCQPPMPLPSGAASGRRLYEQDAGLPDSFEAKDPELRNPSYPPPDEVTLDFAHSTRHSKEQHTPLTKERPVQSQRWWKRIVNTKHQRIFLLVILLQGLAVLALQGAIFGQLDQELDLDNRYLKSISVYLALFILAEITEILFALDALRLRNFLQGEGRD